MKMKLIRFIIVVFMLIVLCLTFSESRKIKDNKNQNDKKTVDKKIKLRHIDELQGHKLSEEQINLLKRKGRKFWGTTTPDPDSDRCLISEKLFNKKYSLKTFASFPDEQSVEEAKKRLRFIEKGCSPVLFIPGLLATRLDAVLNCKKINDDKEFRFDLDVLCGNKICSTREIEVHAFWPNANLSGFYMMHDKNNKNNECFGFFMKFYNTNSSCKETKDSTNKCKYSDYVRMVPHGIEKKEKDEDSDYTERSKEFKCGSSSINNILAFSRFLEQTVNKFSTVTQGFMKLENKLSIMGYETGFSQMALPYDFREAQCNNKHFDKIFEESVNTLFNNTGRKVIIVAHSYGNLYTHFQLRNNHELRKKIKHFISIAPPFTGVSKPNYIIGRGSTEFKKDFTLISLDVSRFAQSIFAPYLMSAYTLRKFNYIESIKKNNPNNTNYLRLATAFENHMDYTTCLVLNPNSKAKCEEKAPNLLTEFPNELSFMKNNAYCESQQINSKQASNFLHRSYVTDENKVTPTKSVCDLMMFDYNNCSNIIVDDRISISTRTYHNLDSDTQKKFIIEHLCSRKNTDKGLYFYNTDCESISTDKTTADTASKKICDREYISQHGMKPNHHQSLLTTANEDMFSKLKKDYKNVGSDINDLDKICEKSKKILQHPGVPVSLIFGRSIETRAAFVSRKNNDEDEQMKYESLFTGGDGTVEADSSLLVGLKWLHDHQQNNQPKVKIFDYCPPVNKDFKTNFYDKSNLKDKNYFFLKCQCYDYDNGYFNPSKLSLCGHAELLSDETIVNLMRDTILENLNQEEATITQNIKRVTTNEGGFIKKCVEIYDKVFYEGFNFDLN